jgi:hypothetical protein
MFLNPPLGAGPRGPPRRVSMPAPWPLPDADAPALDTGNSGRDGTGDHLPFVAMPGPNANAANARLHVGTPDCNNGPGDVGGGRTARTPSKDSGALSAADGSLAPPGIVDHADRSPRELLLPKVKSRREASTSLRDAFIAAASSQAALSLRLIAPAPRRHRPPPASTLLAAIMVQSLAATNRRNSQSEG